MITHIFLHPMPLSMEKEIRDASGEGGEKEEEESGMGNILFRETPFKCFTVNIFLLNKCLIIFMMFS